MQFTLITLTYKKPLNDIDRYKKAHSTHLQQFYDQGLIYFSGPLKPRTGGFILAQALDEDLLEKLVKQDPFYIHDLADYHIQHCSASKVSLQMKS
ncbi:YciI family protein [Facilibium subflavum]|uniref:YciI family protein n=1 Tax=Facilibium subflavum TaxID=2219058 RepID=UPI000E65B9A5|nr:YciI family protein [Facilibium subflavum]